MGASGRFLATAMLMSLAVAYCGCADFALTLSPAEDSEAPDTQTATSEKLAEDEPMVPDAAKPAESCVFVDLKGNRLDYSDTSQFLSQGDQSILSPHFLEDIRRQIDVTDTSMETVGAIFEWKRETFLSEAAGGQYVGKLSVDDIMERGTLTGCHDHGLILACVLREYGFPSVMVDAAGIQWALDHAAGAAEGFSGHIFVETFTEDGWILVDSTSGQYARDYDPCEPVIPLPKDIEPNGYYALLKGVDPDEYGVGSIDDLKRHMLAFAEEAQKIDLSAPTYDVRQLPR